HVVDRALDSGHMFLSVNFQEGAVGNGALGAGDGMGQVTRTDYDFVLSSLAVVLLAASAGGQAQTPPPRRPPTFEAGIEIINLNVSVTDPRNRYVTDL